LKSVYNFYDFSDDPVLKSRAGQFLELYWALWAEEQLDAVTGGAQARCYAKSAERGGSFLRRVAWYQIGFGDPEFVHDSMIPFVTTTWQVPDVVLQTAHNSSMRGAYEISQRRMGLAEKGYDCPPDYRLRTDFGGLLRYTYCTPDFIMGSLFMEARPIDDWAGISSQGRWSGVIFAGDPDARVYPAPYNSKGKSILNGFWSVQAKGTLISQMLKEIRGEDRLIAGEGRAEDWRVFFSSAGLSQPVQEGKWSFAEAKSAFVGVCAVDGSAKFSEKPPKFGRWLVCENKYTPVIIEVGRKSEYESFEVFRKKALAQSVVMGKSTLSYTSLGGDQLTFYTDQSRLPEINGTPVNLAPQKVFNSPFVQSDWNSGVVTIRYGENQRVLDFNKE
jgi:hypothetical protein